MSLAEERHYRTETGGKLAVLIIAARILTACSVLSAISPFYLEVSDLLFSLHVADSLSLAEVSERTGINRSTLQEPP